MRTLDPVDEIYTNPAVVVDLLKLSISFWEKVVVLDVAVFAASFTGAGVLKDHLVFDGGIGYMAAAWKMLLTGVVSCMAAQLIGIMAAAALTGCYHGMRVLALIGSTDHDQVNTPSSLEKDLAISKEILEKRPSLLKKTEVLPQIAGAIGTLGTLVSMWSFYWLYRFARINLPGLHH